MGGEEEEGPRVGFEERSRIRGIRVFMCKTYCFFCIVFYSTCVGAHGGLFSGIFNARDKQVSGLFNAQFYLRNLRPIVLTPPYHPPHVPPQSAEHRCRTSGPSTGADHYRQPQVPNTGAEPPGREVPSTGPHSFPPSLPPSLHTGFEHRLRVKRCLKQLLVSL